MGDSRFQRYCKSNPRKMVKMWAEKEMRNLMRLHAAGINCPKPLQVRSPVGRAGRQTAWGRGQQLQWRVASKLAACSRRAGFGGHVPGCFVVVDSKAGVFAAACPFCTAAQPHDLEYRPSLFLPPLLPSPQLRLHVLVMEFLGKDGVAAPRLKDAGLPPARMRQAYTGGRVGGADDRRGTAAAGLHAAANSRAAVI